MIRRGFLAFLVFGMVGCGDLGPFKVDVEDIVGTYVLQSIDGEPLPAVRFGGPIEVTAGSLILNQDRTCSYSDTFLRTEDGIVTAETYTSVCTYIRLDSESIWIDREGVIPWYGEISGSTITITDHEGEKVGVYQK